MLLSILVKQFDTYCTGYLRSGKAERGCVSHEKKDDKCLLNGEEAEKLFIKTLR